MKDYLGAHMSISGGIHLAPERGVKAGCGVIQIFTQNANQWRGKEISDADALLFREKWAESGLHEVVSHDIYLINLGAPPGEVRDKSLAGFREEMTRCARLGIGKIVMHPGAHTGDGEETGLKRIAEAFDQLFAAVPEYTGKVLLETTAGQGSNVGYRFEHLQAIISDSSFPDRFGVCLDTCHLFAAGHDLATPGGQTATWRAFGRTVGFGRLRLLHLNDSRCVRGSRVDRHALIGRGAIGRAAFGRIVRDRRLERVPMILETPGSLDVWRREIALLRRLAGAHA